MDRLIPPCNIRIDKDGIWYYEGDEILRREIIKYFYENLKRDQSGRYLIELENDCCYLEVDDTPYVVKAVYRTVSETCQEESMHLLLSDQTTEKLEPNSLWVGEENVLYCSIRNGEFYARFSRPSYYQIAQYIEQDSEKNEYFIRLNGESFYIKRKKSKEEYHAGRPSR